MIKSFVLISFLVTSSDLGNSLISYEVWIHPDQKTIDVQATIIPPDTIDTVLLQITPHYGFIKDYYKFIKEIEFSSGNKISVSKIDSSTFKIFPVSRELMVNYKVSITHFDRQKEITTNHPHELPFCDLERCFTTGHAIFIYPMNWEPPEYRIKFHVPQGWGVSTPWAKSGEFYITKNPQDDYLAFGKYRVLGSNIGKFYLMLASEPDRLALQDTMLFNGITKVLKTELDIFHGKTVKDTVLVIINPLQAAGIRMGGSVLSNSIVLSFSKGLTQSQNEEDRLLPFRLIAHEFFHNWNGRECALITAANGDTVGQYWFLEGFTEYYTPTILLRAGLVDSSYLWQYFAETYERYTRIASKDTLSLYEASFTLLGGNKDAYDLSYCGGMLFAFMLDQEIRELSNNKNSLDDLMRYVFEHYNCKMPEYKDGFTTSELLKALKELTGKDFSEFFDGYIKQPNILPFEDYLHRANKKVISEKSLFMGVELDTNLVINKIIKLTPADKSDLQKGDKIIEVNGNKIKSEEEISKLLHYTRNVIKVNRNGEIIEIQCDAEERENLKIVNSP